MFVLAGGPGVGATNMTSWIVETLGPGERDLVLVDARGTGKSNGLHCESDPKELFADLWDPKRIAGCREKLEARADLTQFLSVTCAEDLPRVDERAIRTASAGTVLGTYRLDQQLGACKLWPRATTDGEMAKPVRSSIPTLIVSGELDPVTPPEGGDEVARTLKRALHIVIPAGSHSGDTGGCLEKVLSELVREGSVAELDTTCVKDVKRPPFVLK